MNCKKLLTVLLACVLLTTSVIPAFALESKAQGTGTTMPFTDVPAGAWYESAVLWGVENKLVSGTGAATFSPAMSVTRGMFVTFLCRLSAYLGFNTNPYATADDGFPDVKAGVYYTASIAWARDNRIVSGYADGTFGPDKTITRQEMVSMMCRFVEDYGALNLEEHNREIAFTDSAKIASFAKRAVAVFANLGLVVGSNNSCNPLGVATRAEIVSLLYRLSAYCAEHFTFASYLKRGINIDGVFNYYGGDLQPDGTLVEDDGSDTHDGAARIRAYALNDELYQSLWDAGFDHIRLPVSMMRYSYLNAEGERVLSDDFYTLFDGAVEKARANGLRVVFDFCNMEGIVTDEHGNPVLDADNDPVITDMNAEPSRFHDDFIRLWQLVAERYRDTSALWLGYEIFNEPHDVFQEDGGTLWNTYQMEAYRAIRAIDPDKCLVFDIIYSNSVDYLSSVQLPTVAEDANIILSVHNYESHEFTMPYGNNNSYDALTRNKVIAAMRKIKTFEEETGRQVWLSEFGVYRTRPVDQRALYYDHVTTQAALNGVSYCVWDLIIFSDLYDFETKTFNQTLLAAIMP